MRSVITTFVVLTLSVGGALADGYVSVWNASEPAAQATSSWFGSIGLVLIPSAYTPPASAATIAGHWIDTDPDNSWVVNINFGVTKDLEIGGAYMEMAGGEHETIVSAKYHLDIPKLLGGKNFPDMAVGCWDISDQINRSLYLVLSKSFALETSREESSRITLHAGWAVAERDGGAMDDLFGGLEFTAFRDALVQVEYDGDALNAALRYGLTKSWSVDLGVLDGDFGAGITYRANF